MERPTPIPSETYSTLVQCPHCKRTLHYIFNRVVLAEEPITIKCSQCLNYFNDKPQDRFNKVFNA